jgi:hypothetical protein
VDPTLGGNLFDSFYYLHNCGMPYERNEKWLASFDRVAERIITELNPRTVLDAGCAMGFLVERLRVRGVEAWGIDISEYAIQQVHPDVQPYCWVGSITEPLPRRYDLVVSIEVLEHMPPEDSMRAIERLCQCSDDILLSVSHEDFKEATHFNVQPPDYWARRFASCGFYHDVDFDAGFITPWAARYHKLDGPVMSVIQDYERKLNQLKNETIQLRAANLEAHEHVRASEARLAQMESGVELEQLKGAVKAWEERWADLERGSTWRALKKIQALRVKLVPPGSWLEKLLRRGRS